MTANLENIHEIYNIFCQKNRVNADIINLFDQFHLSLTLRHLKMEKQQGVSASQGSQGQVPPARSELEGHEGGVGRQDKLNGSAQEALNQIKDKGCAKPYAADSRKVIALGINFSSEKGTIDEFISSN